MAERHGVEIIEVGPRDGLQNEPRAIPVAEKIALVDALSTVGYRRIEAGSFVAPKWVPQMAGSTEVFRGLTRATDVLYLALVPNVRGLEDAISAGADEVGIFASASEGFSRANINASVADSLERYKPVVEKAMVAGMPVRGYISCVTDCPYDGPVAPEAVAHVAAALRAMGCQVLSLGDTIGHATPDAMDRLLRVMTDAFDPRDLVGHFHDTNGRALENVDVALSHGIRAFDASVAGLGGCPYAPGAAGNVSTGELARFLDRQGYDHGLDLGRLDAAADMALQMREGTT